MTINIRHKFEIELDDPDFKRLAERASDCSLSVSGLIHELLTWEPPSGSKRAPKAVTQAPKPKVQPKMRKPQPRSHAFPGVPTGPIWATGAKRFPRGLHEVLIVAEAFDKAAEAFKKQAGSSRGAAYNTLMSAWLKRNNMSHFPSHIMSGLREVGRHIDEIKAWASGPKIKGDRSFQDLGPVGIFYRWNVARQQQKIERDHMSQEQQKTSEGTIKGEEEEKKEREETHAHA